jgi:hypothetical protein
MSNYIKINKNYTECITTEEQGWLETVKENIKLYPNDWMNKSFKQSYIEMTEEGGDLEELSTERLGEIIDAAIVNSLQGETGEENKELKNLYLDSDEYLKA